MAKLVTKPELVERVKPLLEEYLGEKISKEQIKRDLEYTNELIKIVAEVLESDEKANLGTIAIENKFVEAKEGVCAGKEYSCEAKNVIAVKATSTLKTIHQ